MRRTALFLVGLVACVRTDSIVCPGGLVVCPADTVCRDVGGGTRCVAPDDIEACTAGTCDGERACHDGVCIPIECGNALLDPGEDCDNGDNRTGSGCSPLCRAEVCGNGTIDPTRLVSGVQVPNEQCDDGDRLGHDGCNASCQVEAPHWTSLSFAFPARRSALAMTYDIARRRFVMFGGGSPVAMMTTRLGDTYESDTGEAWIQATTTSSPSPRTDHAMAYDAARHRSVLFGGFSGAPFGDTWLWDGTGWTYAAPAPGAKVPPPRSRHAMAYDPVNRRIVMSGGEDVASKTLGDTWVWDGTAWSLLPIPEVNRQGASLVFDPVHGQLLLIGGFGLTSYEPSTWHLESTGWVEFPGAQTPAGMIAGAAAYDPATQHVIALPVMGPAEQVTYSWDGAHWSALSGTPLAPSRAAAGVASDPFARRVVLFGGFDDSGIAGITLGDLWTWDGTAWSQPRSGFQPFEPRAYRAAAYDSLRRVVVSFGGVDDAKDVRNDTFQLAGDRWVKSSSTVTPRLGAALAFDAAHRETVMFGGAADQGAPLGIRETWTWDGAVWTEKSLITSPPGRYFHAMAYDAKRKRVVMYGGQTSPSTLLQDTWEWDGTAWTDVSTPGAGPQPRTQASLVYDPLLERVVLFGGAGPDGRATDELWSWSGTSWDPLPQAPGPNGRQAHGVAWDAARARMVVTYGVTRDATGYFTLPDTWEWDGATWSAVIGAGAPPLRVSPMVLPDPGGAGVTLMDGDVQPDISRAKGSFGDFWRMRFDGGGDYEACIGGADTDGDGAAGCADPDCWGWCAPMCPPGAPCDPTWPRCGDTVCDPARENCRNCPNDCTCTPVCGDLACDASESAASCPGDCP